MKSDLFYIDYGQDREFVEEKPTNSTSKYNPLEAEYVT